MASSWKIKRGVKTNRVQGDRRGRGTRKGKQPAPHAFDPSPQRAKNKLAAARKSGRRQEGNPGDLWTQISISLRVADLIEIDNLADVMDLSRSALLVKLGLGLLKRLR